MLYFVTRVMIEGSMDKLNTAKLVTIDLFIRKCLTDVMVRSSTT